MPVSLPEPRDPGPYRIAVVCLGNICRSPTAEVVLEELLDRGGLAAEVRVDSFGTGTWHIGERMDARSAAVLAAEGYDPDVHRARRLPADWTDDYDLVLAMDNSHLDELLETSRSRPDLAGRVRLFRDFDPVDPGGEVPDPYYGGPQGFEEVLAMVERTSVAIVAALQREITDR
ncbi:MAG: low molecular weight phosphotyrosine protein phosphatase [Nocardioidaceae bacterium]|nr:low molecular weight phosphotyrosine protein phosphatase [Nocardioidaceae bacterium]